MKKTDELLDPNSCLNRSQLAEPLFVLCARDQFAPNIVRRWADIVEAATHPDSPARRKVETARQLARDMETWQAEYGHKVPD